MGSPLRMPLKAGLGGVPPVGLNPEAKRFLITWMLTIFVICASFGTLAYIVNPRAIFSTKIFPAVIWNSRGQKLVLFEKFVATHSVDSLILGSSRSMLTSPKELQVLTGFQFFNFCVDSGRAEDYEALFNWVVGHGISLKVVLLGLDVEALHNNDQFDPRLKSNPQLMRALNGRASGQAFDRSVDFLGSMRAVFSLPYIREMYASVYEAVSKRGPRQQIDEDGTVHYLDYKEQKKIGSFDLKANIRQSMTEYRRRFVDMERLSPSRMERVRRLLRKALAMRARVVVWITPIHPAVASYLKIDTHYSEVLDATRIFARRLNLEFGIPVLDLSELPSFSGTENGWYDGGHVDEGNAQLITARVIAALR